MNKHSRQCPKPEIHREFILMTTMISEHLIWRTSTAAAKCFVVSDRVKGKEHYSCRTRHAPIQSKNNSTR